MDFIINHSSLFISIGVIALIALIGYYADKKDSKKNNTSKPVTKGSDVESSVSSQSEDNINKVPEDKPEVLNFDNMPEVVSEPSVPETIDIPANDAVETPVAAAPEFTSDLSDFLINPDDPNVYSANNNVQMAPMAGSYVAPVSPIGVVPDTPVVNPAPVNPVPVVSSVPEPVVSPVQGPTVSSVTETISIPEQPSVATAEAPVYETPVVNEVPVEEAPVVVPVETPVSETPVVNEVPVDETASIREGVEQPVEETIDNVSTVSEPISPVGNLYVSSSFENVDMSLEDLEKKNYEKIVSKKSVEKEDDDSENYFYSDLDDGVSESYDETSVDDSNEQTEVSEQNVEDNSIEPNHFSELVVDNDVPVFNQENSEPATDFQPIPDLDNTIPEVNQNTENQESVPDLNSGVVSENFDFNSSSDNMWNF